MAVRIVEEAMIDERILSVGQLSVVDGPSDTFWNGEWTHHENRAYVPEREWIGNNELELRQAILAEAIRIGATTIIWRMEPQMMGALLAYAICGMCRIAQSDSFGSVLPPSNNDGLSSCFWCGIATEEKQGFTSTYNICPKCKK
jgi:hypothetical protein